MVTKTATYNLSKIYRSHHHGLANTETSHETAGINST